MLKRHTQHLKRAVAAFCGAAIGLGSVALHAQAQVQAQEPDQEMARLVQEIQQIQAQLEPIEERALEEESVSTQWDAFISSINSFIVRQEPALEEAVERRQELVDSLTDHPELADHTQQPSEEVQSMIQEYQQLEQQVAPIRQRALQDETVLNARESFQQALTAQMTSIEPEASALLERREQLIQAYQQRQAQQQEAPAAEEY